MEKRKCSVDSADGSHHIAGDRRRLAVPISAAGKKCGTGDNLFRSSNRSRLYHAYHRRQVGLFREGSSVPYQKLQVPLNLLSDYDRHALEQGITVSDEAALQRLIEDYFS